MGKRNQEEYESDGGFIEDAPKSKKAKASRATETKKPAVSDEVRVDDEGNEYWELSRTRRVGISEFKNTKMISIREYYEKDGRMLPGKKGISLTLEQYTALLNVIPQIESSLKMEGVDVPRPNYEARASTEAPETGPDDEANDGDPMDSKASTSRLDKYKMRANHEATSDEDEG